MDILVWPDDFKRALDVMAALDEADILHVNLLAPASMVDAALLVTSLVANVDRRSAAVLQLKLIPAEYPTWRASDLRRRYEEIALAPDAATGDDIEALLAGWRRVFQHGGTRELVKMAERLPAGLVEQDGADGVSPGGARRAWPRPPRAEVYVSVHACGARAG